MLHSARGRIHQVSLTVNPVAEEAAAELLTEIFQQPASIETDLERGTTQVRVYLERQASLGSKKKMRAGLQRIEECGLGKVGLRLRQLRREDWAESWKRHFKPIEIRNQLLVLPSWSRRKPRRGHALVVLDPGLSFGTGQHPTTRFCLEAIVASKRGSLLDLGTGSGILAIAGAKLGHGPIEAIDLDPTAVRIAKDNARRNGVAERIAFSRKDLTHIPLQAAKKFDLICANLVYDVLIAERRRIVNRLKPKGRLVLAGVLESQFADVESAFRKEGLKLARAKTVKEWRSGAFDFSASVP